MLIYQSLCKAGMPLFENMTVATNTGLARAKYNDTVVTSVSKFKGVNAGSEAMKKTMIPNPLKTALPPDARYPHSRHYTYSYYRVLDRALNMSISEKYVGNKNKYYFSVMAMFKNEAAALKEWLDHHIAHGVEHFYLVNDNSNDKPEEILKPYVASGKVSMHSAPSQNIPFRQAALYKKLFTEIYSKNETRWVCIYEL
jgi:hypothetical protein